MVDILGIHGVGNYRPEFDTDCAADSLAAAWRKHISVHGQPLAGASLQVAYYAHLLAMGDVQGPANFVLQDPEIAEMLMVWAGLLGAPSEITEGRLLQPVRQTCAWIAETFGLDHGLVRCFVAVFLREVHIYLHDDQAIHRRAAVLRLVAEAIRRHAPRVIIAHSLGSVVAYEALWEYPDLLVDTLLTLGSPLGMPDIVFNRLRPAPEDSWGARPPNVVRWVNIADHGDLIALPRHLSKRFHGLQIDAETSMAPFDFHRIAAYLRSTFTGDLLCSHLRTRSESEGERP